MTIADWVDRLLWEQGVYHPLELRPARPQMDLFMDSQPMVLERDLIDALGAGRLEAAEAALQRLRTLHTDRARTAELAELTAFRQALDSLDPRQALERLEAHLESLARRRLGERARDYLLPLWRCLAARLAALPFDPRRPRCHASHAALQGLAWGEALAAVERESDWRDQPALLERHALACCRLGRRDAALGDWFRLCWLFPAAAEPVLSAQDLPDPELRLVWRTFGDLDADLETTAFPGWWRLTRTGPADPAIAGMPDTLEAAQTYQVIDELRRLSQPAAGADYKRLLELRTRLRQRHPGLFELYMALFRQRD